MSVLEVMSLNGLGVAVAEARRRKALCNEELALARDEEAKAEQMLLDAMEAQGVKSTHIDGVGVAVAKVKTSASYKVEDLEKVMAWVRGMGPDYEKLIREQILPSQFTGTVKELMEAGKAIPAFVKVYEEIKLSLTKKED